MTRLGVMIGARRLAAAAALCLLAPVLAALLAPAPGAAQEAKNLMGEWVVRPFTWQSGAAAGCRYRQSIFIRKRLSAQRYKGLSISGFTCNGTTYGDTRTPITIEVEGRTVRLKSRRPSWMTETLDYVSPYLMKGKDTLGHTMIYERPKGPPTS